MRELTQHVAHVALGGDGVNDAPVLAEATVAMGAAGTGRGVMADDLEKLVYVLKLS